MKFNAKLFFERLKSKVVQIYVHKKKLNLRCLILYQILCMLVNSMYGFV